MIEEAIELEIDEREKILLKTVIKHRKKLSNGNPYASLFYLIEISWILAHQSEKDSIRIFFR